MKFNDLSLQWKAVEKEALPKLIDVLNTGNYILGGPVNEFEKAFAAWNGNKYAIGVANGTDALKICVASLNLQGVAKFYIPANTYIATLLGVVFSMFSDGSNSPSYEYELVDCDEYHQIDCRILEESLVRDHGKFDNLIVMPVHLYGHSCDMETLMSLKQRFGFKMIEDCSQAHGTVAENGKKVGCFGEISAFSLYPGKNLGAAGDAGIIVTDNEELMKRCLYLRNLGSMVKYKHDIIGWNSRLDTIQSVILNEKLKHMDVWNSSRIEIAKRFGAEISNPAVMIPATSDYCKVNTYHVYPLLVENRDAFMSYLSERGVPTIIHYPVPIEKSGAFHRECHNKRTLNYSERLVSIPMHPFLTDSEVSHIISCVNGYIPNPQ